MNDLMCLDCETPMKLKVWLPIGADGEGQGGYNLYQCPACKNIEID